MTPEGKPFVIALEEHYYDPELAATFDGPEGRAPETRRRLDDLGELRLKEMDEAGIDVQVISHGAPSTQRLDAEAAVRLARNANDRLSAAIAAHPDRFAAFAALPTPDPKAAADELERTVTQLGFKGAMVHGLTNGVFFDDKRFWPIFERAQALDVPLYVHPAVPHRAVVEAYYQDYLADFPTLANCRLGVHRRDRHPGHQTGPQRCVRRLPGREDHPGAYGRGAAVLAVAHRPCAVAPRQSLGVVPRAVQPALLHHHQRQLLHPGAALLHDGAGRGSYPVLGGLALRAEYPWDEVDE